MKPLPVAPLTREDDAILWKLIGYPRTVNGAKWLRTMYFQDRRDAARMYEREMEKARALPCERWETHRRQWFPSSWGLTIRVDAGDWI
jgi:hypothetical protein